MSELHADESLPDFVLRFKVKTQTDRQTDNQTDRQTQIVILLSSSELTKLPLLAADSDVSMGTAVVTVADISAVAAAHSKYFSII